VIWRLLTARLRAEDGFTMVATMGILVTVGMLSVAAFAATDGDLRSGADDKERKGAYAAAEAGVNDYLARLIADTEYWRKCDDATHPGLNQRNVNANQRQWATIAGSTAQYSIELLPANGNAICNDNDAQNTFIDNASGTFRIRSTGRSSARSNERRSIIATFRRRGFLDYIWFTDYETQNPQFYARNSRGQVNREDPRAGTPAPPQRDIVTWAEEECATYWRDDRTSKRFNGNDFRQAGRLDGGTWRDLTNVPCGEINFISGDALRGPMHTNDEFLVCGNPVFGGRPQDDIEVSGPAPNSTAPGWRNCGSGAPQVNDPADTTPDPNLGTWRRNAPLVTMPPSNSSLKNEAIPSYRFKGETTIVLTGSSMTVTGKRENGQQLNNVSLALPTDGVIYVSNDDDPADPACTGYLPLQPSAASRNCGDVRLRGNYSKNITIGAENDIVIEENVTRNGDFLLGLISNNFIRVYHPVSSECNWSGGGSNQGGPGSITIDAAILSVLNSFTVDSWWCGTEIGTLTVRGAIAQRFRGTVGQTGNTGYLKDYQYDTRLRFRSPPHFLDPVQAGWKIQNYVEQVPPTR
jgi:Tfp pilus assembly protein PilX